MQIVGMFVGALIAVFLVSRLIIAILKRWTSGTRLLVMANGLSLVITTVIAGLGMADGRGFVPLEALSIYGPAQLVTLLLDFWRQSRRAQSGGPASTGKDD